MKSEDILLNKYILMIIINIISLFDHFYAASTLECISYHQGTLAKQSLL